MAGYEPEGRQPNADKCLCMHTYTTPAHVHKTGSRKHTKQEAGSTQNRKQEVHKTGRPATMTRHDLSSDVACTQQPTQSTSPLVTVPLTVTHILTCTCTCSCQVAGTNAAPHSPTLTVATTTLTMLANMGHSSHGTYILSSQA